MTAEEAARESIEFSVTFGGLKGGDLRLNLNKLRTLGYVIVPIQPSEAMVERMAVALFNVAPFRDAEGPFESQSATYRELTRVYVRAAYAAITDTARLSDGKAG